MQKIHVAHLVTGNKGSRFQKVHCLVGQMDNQKITVKFSMRKVKDLYRDKEKSKATEPGEGRGEFSVPPT